MIRFSHSLVVATAAFVGLSLATPSQAQSPPHWANRWQGNSWQGYFPYQNPDGTYNSAADYSRSSWGIPCGITCMRSAQERWTLYYTPHRVPYGP